MEELDYLNSQLKDIKKRIENERKREVNRQAADDLKKIYDDYLSAGFTEEQAWWLTGQLFLKAIGANNG